MSTPARKKYLRHDVYLQTEERAEQLVRLAQGRGCTISALVRALIDEEAERQGRPVPQAELARELRRLLARLKTAPPCPPPQVPAQTSLKL